MTIVVVAASLLINAGAQDTPAAPSDKEDSLDEAIGGVASRAELEAEISDLQDKIEKAITCAIYQICQR